MKQVIFVGGNAFSGTTYFHLILANDPEGFACGEVVNLFRPIKANHAKLVNSLDGTACQVLWKRVYERGESLLYETIFDLRPDVEFIVDSSKNPFWIRSQNINLESKGIAYKNILIWKTPLEYAYSLRKRGQLQDWDKKWLNYHRTYFAVIDRWRAVKNGDVTDDPKCLQKICDFLEIPYYPQKEAYWSKQHCQLGGNYSAKFHFLSPQRAATMLQDTHDQDRMHQYRQIYQSKISDSELIESVGQKVRSSQRIGLTIQMLNRFDVDREPTSSNALQDVKFPEWLVQLRRLKYEVSTLLGKRRYPLEIDVT